MNSIHRNKNESGGCFRHESTAWWVYWAKSPVWLSEIQRESQPACPWSSSCCHRSEDFRDGSKRHWCNRYRSVLEWAGPTHANPICQGSRLGWEFWRWQRQLEQQVREIHPYQSYIHRDAGTRERKAGGGGHPWAAGRFRHIRCHSKGIPSQGIQRSPAGTVSR